MNSTLTIYLLWQLFGGQPRDVDSFLVQATCEESKARGLAMLVDAYAQTHNEQLKQVTFVGCFPTAVQVPAEAQIPRENSDASRQ